jgi:hypothetical protein
MSKRKKTGKNKRIAVDPDTLGLIEELSMLYGNPHNTLNRLIRSTDTFRQWRTKHARCRKCKRWIVVEYNEEGQAVLEGHKQFVQGEGGFYPIDCAGSGSEADPFSLAESHTDEVLIRHHIDTIQPGLL